MKATTTIKGLLILVAFLMTFPSLTTAAGWISSEGAEFTLKGDVTGIHKKFTLVREDHMWLPRVMELTIEVSEFESTGKENVHPAITQFMIKNQKALRAGVRAVNMDSFYKPYRKAFGKGVRGPLLTGGSLMVTLNKYSDRTDISCTYLPAFFKGAKGNWTMKENGSH